MLRDGKILRHGRERLGHGLRIAEWKTIKTPDNSKLKAWYLGKHKKHKQE